MWGPGIRVKGLGQTWRFMVLREQLHIPGLKTQLRVRINGLSLGTPLPSTVGL